MNHVWMSHYLPPVSFGGCEDLTLTLAQRYGGYLYCPRGSGSKKPGFLSGTPTYKGIYRRRGIDGDRVVFQERVSILAHERIDTVFIMGLYWPEIMALGLRSIGSASRIVLVPQYHIGDGATRLRRAQRLGIGKCVNVVMAYTKVEADYVVKHLKCPQARVVLVPHLAGICVENESTLPRATEFGKVKGDPGVLAKGYVLFPSRPSKGLPAAKSIARQLRLPIVGNMSYGVSGVDGCIDFDRFNPYKGARLMVSLTKNDSYNIGIAKSMEFKVPAIWDNSNSQIQSIWNEFPTAIPRVHFKGRDSLKKSRLEAEACKQLLRLKIAKSLARFERNVIR